MILDYSTSMHYVWALLPEVVLTIAGMLVLLVDVFQKEDRSEPSSPLIDWLTLGGVILAAVANFWLLRLDEVGTTGMIALDEFRVFVNFLLLLAVGLFVLVAPRYLEDHGMRLGEIHSLVLLGTVGMMIFAGARDLMLIFIGLELLSICVYVLTAVNRRDVRSAEAGLKYFLLGAFSSAFFLFGIALLFGGAGTVNLSLLGAVIGPEGVGANALVITGMTLVLVGYGFKVAAVPFHMWTPDAYEGAPAPVTGFMAAAVKAAAFASLIRVFMTAFPGLYETWGELVFWLAVLTMIVANLVALAQDSVKRMLAYSSIAHAGYLLVALAAASTLGSASFLFYLVVYTLMTIGAFAVLMVVGRTGERRLDISAYGGLGWERPFLGVVMTVFLLSLAGFPFTGGFIGKVFILRAAVEKGLIVLGVVLVVTSLLSYWYYLRVAWYMWFREAPDPDSHGGIRLAPGVGTALAISAAGVLLLGIFPGELLEVAERSATALTQLPDDFLGGALESAGR